MLAILYNPLYIIIIFFAIFPGIFEVLKLEKPLEKNAKKYSKPLARCLYKNTTDPNNTSRKPQTRTRLIFHSRPLTTAF